MALPTLPAPSTTTFSAATATSSRASVARLPAAENRASVLAVGRFFVESRKDFARGPRSKWWRRGESNPRPKDLCRRCLRVQPALLSRPARRGQAPHWRGQLAWLSAFAPERCEGPSPFTRRLHRVSGRNPLVSAWLSIKQPERVQRWQLCVSACFTWRRTTTRCRQPSCPPSNPVRPQIRGSPANINPFSLLDESGGKV